MIFSRDQPVVVTINESSITLTSAVAVTIFVPPEAPSTSLTLPLLSITNAGAIEDTGRLPGAGRLGSCWSGLPLRSGREKSSNSLLNIIPVLLPIRPIPNL